MHFEMYIIIFVFDIKVKMDDQSFIGFVNLLSNDDSFSFVFFIIYSCCHKYVITVFGQACSLSMIFYKITHLIRRFAHYKIIIIINLNLII